MTIATIDEQVRPRQRPLPEVPSGARAPRRSGRGAAWRVGLLAALGALAPLAYGLARPWHLRWGATDEEARRALPGDDLVPRRAWQATRAITIHAPAEAIWPWLAQMGQGRGGLYSYDWLENLIGCDLHSAGRIIPEFQHIQAGETFWLARGVWGENGPRYTVAAVEPNHALVLRVPQAAEAGTGAPFDGTWAFVLEPLDARNTRLIVRSRNYSQPAWMAPVFSVEPIHFIMERKMLLGIKERAERAWASRGAEVDGRPAADRGTLPSRPGVEGRRAGLRRFLKRVRGFNKRFINPSVLTFAGRYRLPWVVVRHRGRRSGREYATPVVAQRTADGFVIPLPYGDDVDWCRNVRVAGRCTIKWGGVAYPVVGPELIDQAAALTAFAPAMRIVFRLVGLRRFLKVTRPSVVPPETAVSES